MLFAQSLDENLAARSSRDYPALRTARPIAAEGLRPAIYGQTMKVVPADHRAKDRKRYLFFCRTCGKLHQVVKDVSAGSSFRDAWHFRHVLGGGRAASLTLRTSIPRGVSRSATCTMILPSSYPASAGDGAPS